MSDLTIARIVFAVSVIWLLIVVALLVRSVWCLSGK
jgi:hypothetical protein